MGGGRPTRCCRSRAAARSSPSAAARLHNDGTLQPVVFFARHSTARAHEDGVPTTPGGLLLPPRGPLGPFATRSGLAPSSPLPTPMVAQPALLSSAMAQSVLATASRLGAQALKQVRVAPDARGLPGPSQGQGGARARLADRHVASASAGEPPGTRDGGLAASPAALAPAPGHAKTLLSPCPGGAGGAVICAAGGPLPSGAGG